MSALGELLGLAREIRRHWHDNIIARTPRLVGGPGMKFRSKVVEIEAIRWTGDQFDGVPRRWLDEALLKGKTGKRLTKWDVGAVAIVPVRIGEDLLEIATLEGVMIASPGDWIIRGTEGELYPCKPPVFERKYEPVEDQNG